MGIIAGCARTSPSHQKNEPPAPYGRTFLTDQDSEAAHLRRAARLRGPDHDRRPPFAARHERRKGHGGQLRPRACAYPAGWHRRARRGDGSQGHDDGRPGLRPGLQDVSRGGPRRGAQGRRQGGMGQGDRARREDRLRPRDQRHQSDAPARRQQRSHGRRGQARRRVHGEQGGRDVDRTTGRRDHCGSGARRNAGQGRASRRSRTCR